MNLFSLYISEITFILDEISSWIAVLPPFLRNSNLWSAIFGAIVTKATIEHTELKRNRIKEVNQFNSIITVIISALETAFELKGQFAIAARDELLRARQLHELTGGYKTTIQTKSYLLQYWPPKFHISRALIILNKMDIRSGRLMRSMYRLDDAACLLHSTMQQRNRMVEAYRLMRAKSNTPERRTELYTLMYGLPLNGTMDATMSGLTEAIHLYADDTLKFALVALDNVNQYSQHFMTKSQRSKLFKYEQSKRHKDRMPSADHLKELIDTLRIPKKKPQRFFQNNKVLDSV